jgi:acetyl esterase/lipase
MMRTQARFLVLVAFMLAALSSAVGQEKKAELQIPPGVIYEKDVESGKGGETMLHLDIARPEKSDKPAPCIVVIHGGGWRGGNFKVHVPQILEFAKRGYVSATIQYRLVPTARFPAQIEDVKCAVRYLRANADKYGINKERFGAVGFSAGAHLSMLLGTMDAKDGLEGKGGNPDQSSKVQAVVSFFGPTDLAQKDFPAAVNGMLYDFLDGMPQDKPDVYKAASPVTYVDKGDAPMLLYQGTKDGLVPYNQANLMADAMTNVGLAGRVELLLGANHGWGNPELARTMDGTIAFFDQQLKK